MVLGLYPFTDIAADGVPRLDAAAGEKVVRVERAAALALGPRAPEPPGTLFLTTRRVIWVSGAEKGKGYAVDFVTVSLHAVSRDPEAYPSPCIYTQIETEDGSDEESDDSDSETNGEIEVSKVTEMRIIPSDPGQLDGLFEAFSHCAELNPDPNAESDEESGWVHGDEGDEDMTDGSDIECEFSDVNPIGQTDDHDIAHAVVKLKINEQRFEDAEEEDQESHGNGH
ncbi:chloride conductance regulatory protein ICln-like [Phragmites australis]|uniref:chloride conductance regulatory protein ICln-like n=1 Tax=Phragmites australis TaxID=29695 RepID=UPI002D79A381|nr:chloride conductance regulatory protein ICln-like [Phragmites australis]